jgi:hypothetical protein
MAVGRRRSRELGDGSQQIALCCERTARCAVQQEPASTSGEVRQENAFTRACCVCRLPDRWSALSSARAVSSSRSPRPSPSPQKSLCAVCSLRLHRLSESLAFLDRCSGWMWQADPFAAPGSLDFRRQYVEIVPLVQTQQDVVPPPLPPRAIRSHHRGTWHDRLACNACWGPPQLRIRGLSVFPPLNYSKGRGAR